MSTCGSDPLVKIPTLELPPNATFTQNSMQSSERTLLERFQQFSENASGNVHKDGPFPDGDLAGQMGKMNLH